MTYRQALHIAFVEFGTSWRLLPRYGSEILQHLGDALAVLGTLLLILLGPVLALLAPVTAFLVLKADRANQRGRREAQRKIDEHYGSRHQRVEK
ncbi:hypothetical protein [Achromobacter sp. ACRQX]|uniref:hypothetical protein n=1 Tax=Achromobacter sp. ACRQX TaxID=2918181 RepID=UPI001EF32EB7|nr:hypothetical protein [Achromobacter sp. ACRQX]MCG7328041.1 hypothetical protein [Achromobacter sp. ACRQX]